MLRGLALAVSLLVALAVCAMAWIYLVTEDPKTATATATAPAPAAPAAPAQPAALVALPQPVPSPAPAPEPTPGAFPEPDDLGLPRYEPPRGSWEAVAPVARAAAAGPAGAAVGRALLSLQRQLSACFDEGTVARFGRERVTQTLDLERLEDQGVTVLMLEVETSPGRAVIVDAPVETRGSAPDGAIACAQGVLRGRTVRTTDTRAPARHRILFNLHP